jgi:hypothetical protein
LIITKPLSCSAFSMSTMGAGGEIGSERTGTAAGAGSA